VREHDHVPQRDDREGLVNFNHNGSRLTTDD
jgi:hypothetical protein